GCRRMNAIEIVNATAPGQIEAVRALFIEYAEWLQVDLCFQQFDAELAELPGAYGVPAGVLLLAVEGDFPVGCAGVRPIETGICEMKRLYIRPDWRKQGAGRALAQAAIEAGRRLDYRTMRLDTLRRMIAANELYESLGFRDIPAYYANPLEGARYMELALTS